MAAFVRLTPDRPQLDPAATVLAPEDYARAVDAAALRETAERDASAIRREAETEAARLKAEAEAVYEAEKRRGFEDGLAAGQAEVAERMVTLVTRSVDYLASAEGEVARTVLVCLRKILGEFPEEDLVLRAARAALGLVRSESRIRLCVRPEVEPALRDRVGALLAGHGDIGFVEIVGDPSMTRGGCRLETELGVVDASIEQQLDALEKAIRHGAGLGSGA